MLRLSILFLLIGCTRSPEQMKQVNNDRVLSNTLQMKQVNNDRVLSNTLQMHCVDLEENAYGEIARCENTEAICYTHQVMRGAGISCKFKK